MFVYELCGTLYKNFSDAQAALIDLYKKYVAEGGWYSDHVPNKKELEEKELQDIIKTILSWDENNGNTFTWCGVMRWVMGEEEILKRPVF